MPNNKKAIDGQYLVKAYETASDSWTPFLKSQAQADLNNTLVDLCNAHRRLETDAKFWAALHELPSDLEEHRKGAERILADFDSFLSFEEKILRNPSAQIKLRDDPTAKRLMNDINFVLGDVDLARAIVQDRPDARTIENLRNRAVHLQQAVCGTLAARAGFATPPVFSLCAIWA